MKLEVGKSYRTRDGRKATITGLSGKVDWPFQSNLTGGLGYKEIYKTDGTYSYEKSDLDLISEWKEEMTRTEFEKQIADKENEIANMKRQLADMPKGYWEPRKGDDYWCVCGDGNTLGIFCSENTLYKNIIAQGNAFPTREAAEKESRRRIVMTKLRKIADGFVPDWKNGEQNKWYISYEHKIEKWKIYEGFFHRCFDIFFATKEQAKQAIALGDELDVLL